jgi:acyl-CoA thioesterase FadM
MAGSQTDCHLASLPYVSQQKHGPQCSSTQCGLTAKRAHAARHELLEAEGLEHVEGIAGYALSELHIKYRAPLRHGDRFLATVAVGRVTRVRATFVQRLIRLDPDNADCDEVRTEKKLALRQQYWVHVYYMLQKHGFAWGVQMVCP